MWFIHQQLHILLNLETFKKVQFLINESHIDSIMHGATIKVTISYFILQIQVSFIYLIILSY